MNPPSWGLVLVRVVVGFVMLAAAWAKIDTGFTDAYVTRTGGAWAAAPEFVRLWGENIVLKHPTAFAHLAVWGEFAIGLSMFLGALTRPLGLAGAFLYANAWFVVETDMRPLALVLSVACLGCAISRAGARSGLDVFLDEKLPSFLTWSREG